MVTGGAQQPSATARSSTTRTRVVGLPGEPRPAGLAGDLHALARAVALATSEPRWRETVLLRLHPVGQGFAEHVRATEGPAGLYRELLTHSPRLDHGIRLLTREHAPIVAAVLTMQRLAERSEASPDELRRRAGHLLRTLARHRRRGADLLWQAYQTDLGGET
ncbi:hypothetical protein ACGFIE_12540 [Micromonospora sp. NPDC049275]|uniref:hypothetical protein n=1 Tax=Micromonospora sp. NPDC049275 TaxID=3364268 RepID=UPI0037244D5F